MCAIVVVVVVVGVVVVVVVVAHAAAAASAVVVPTMLCIVCMRIPFNDCNMRSMLCFCRGYLYKRAW